MPSQTRLRSLTRKHPIPRFPLSCELDLMVGNSPDLARKVVLTDFGISQHFKTTSRISGPGFKSFYVSPQKAAGRKYGRKTDVWSLGIVFLQVFMKIGKVSSIMKRLTAEDGLGWHPEILSQATVDKVIEKAMTKALVENEKVRKEAIKLLGGMIQREEMSRFNISEVAIQLRKCAAAWDSIGELHCRDDPSDYVYSDELEDTDESPENEQDEESRGFWA